MSSGFGLRGGVSRCFNIYHDLERCISAADTELQCLAYKQDYLECLHHTKEVRTATLLWSPQAPLIVLPSRDKGLALLLIFVPSFLFFYPFLFVVNCLRGQWSLTSLLLSHLCLFDLPSPLQHAREMELYKMKQRADQEARKGKAWKDL